MELRPLTSDLLDTDYRQLTCFAEGACWCAINQYATISSDEWTRLCDGEGPENRGVIVAALERGDRVGYLAYRDGTAIGWCGCGALSSYPRFQKRAEVLGAQARDVAAIVCFAVSEAYKRQGIASLLLQQVCEALFAEGYLAIEAYPFPEAILAQPNHDRGWMGYPTMYRAAGFVPLVDPCPHAKPGEDRPVYRLERPEAPL